MRPTRRSLIQTGLAAGWVLIATRSSWAAPIEARASGIVPPIRQPNDMACWATVTTMMHSWKQNRSLEITTVLKTIGQRYVDIFNNNDGLDAADKPAFLQAAGLKAEAPQNYTAEGWAKLIRAHGPLWVTTNEGVLSARTNCASNKFAIHARVLTAISGDGTGAGTSLIVVDPADGKVHSGESLLTFAKRFEDVARIDTQKCGNLDADLRPQVVHY
jgi:hypothetical protein